MLLAQSVLIKFGGAGIAPQGLCGIIMVSNVECLYLSEQSDGPVCRCM